MAANKYEFDASHSNVGFWVRHLMVAKVHGNFTKWQGTLVFDEQNPAATAIDVTLDAASIDTREPQRDDHLRSADFFDVANHPHLTYQAQGAEKIGDDHYRVRGNLTIRGTTRPVDLDVEYAGAAKDPWGNQRVGFSARASVNRKDFGLTWNQALETGGVLVGEKIEITLDVEAKLAAAAAAA